MSLLGIVLLCGACTNIYTARGIYHRVQPHETLQMLADRYHVPLQDLAELNNVEDPTALKVGKSIFIPGVRAGHFAPSRFKKSRIARQTGGDKAGKRTWRQREDGIQVDHGRFKWPLQGELSSLYGVRRGRRHDGIDIRSPRGTSVYAAADGEVVYSKRMRGYGNLILLKHAEDFFTVYAHNAVNLVKKGVMIKQGQLISKVGSTGRATGPHLHFEVREGSKPRNPLFFLPNNGYVEKARIKEPTGEIGGH